MKYPWIESYLMRKAAVTTDVQQDWNWVRYHIGGKMFAAVCLNREGKPYYITLKAEPAEAEFLRGQYEDIIPGYYMNKQHWISVKADGQVPDELLKALLDKAYHLVLAGFSKKKQRELLSVSCCGTDCTACSCYGSMCPGCNACDGRVFHVPQGQACPIYACVRQEKCMRDCSACGQVPCEIWLKTRDPRYSDEEFTANVAQRLRLLKQEE